MFLISNILEKGLPGLLKTGRVPILFSTEQLRLRDHSFKYLNDIVNSPPNKNSTAYYNDPNNPFIY